MKRSHSRLCVLGPLRRWVLEFYLWRSSTLLEPALVPHFCFCVSSPSDIAISGVSFVRFIGSFVKSVGLRAVQAIGLAQQLCLIQEGAERLHQRCCISSGHFPASRSIHLALTHPTCHIRLSQLHPTRMIFISCAHGFHADPLLPDLPDGTPPAPSVCMDRYF